MSWLTRLLGDPNERELKKLHPFVARINQIEPDFEKLSDEELAATTQAFKQRRAAGEDLDHLLPEAFAVVREAAKRALGQRHYDVQLLGGIVLHQGKIAEMKTGEGKTLVATLPAYLNALDGKGVHVVTVNDYLARRDAAWMGPVYERLGMHVGVIQHDLDPTSRQAAYRADITYGTNNEFGFDYLRDNMVLDLVQCVQRELHYAIVDEVDNILIDEARTPLIISGPAEESTDNYYRFADIVRRLQREVDYTVDEKLRAVTLTEQGIDKVERLAGVDNIYGERNYQLAHYLEQALKALVLFRRDRDYVVENGQVIIIDEFTGRKMTGRRYSEGLHQAIEAKEGVKVERENKTLATITFQNYFRLYDKLAGMTGTAVTEAEEFHKIYNLDVTVIPTHRPMQRKDLPDQVYKNEAAKFRAVVEEIEALHAEGRPVLIGTVSIEKSEKLSEQLKRRGIPHEVLNAKQHEREAAIIAQAGQPGAVTVATNMAGRGVDILLGGNPEGLARQEWERSRGEKDFETLLAKYKALCSTQHDRVLAMGGLHIIGTERHEARRIDNQLRGRSGRQGDPGSSRFYLSLEDDLMRRFASDRIAGIMEKLGLEDDVPIEHGLVSRAIESAQTKVEGFNFDLRKHLVEYDDVINKQREIIYGERLKVLKKEDLDEVINKMIHDEVQIILDSALAGNVHEEWDLPGLLNNLQGVMPLPPRVTLGELERRGREEIEELIHEAVDELYEQREKQFGTELMRQVERFVMLRVIDMLWIEHLTSLDDLRQGIGLRAYGQRDPLVEYKAEAFRMFEMLRDSIRREVARTLFHVQPITAPPPPPAARPTHTNRENGAAPRQPVRAAVGAKVGRNDPCPCGSGKKYKRCHGG